MLMIVNSFFVSYMGPMVHVMELFAFLWIVSVKNIAFDSWADFAKQVFWKLNVLIIALPGLV